MANITTRATAGTGATVKGAPLTNGEVDQNFLNLNAGKVEIATDGSSAATNWTLSAAAAEALHRSPNAITALLVFDTGRGSDGGAFIERLGGNSLATEALNGTWRGAITGAALSNAETTCRAISGATTGDIFQYAGDGKIYKLNAGSGTTQVYRGNKAKWPRLMALVGESLGLFVYDLTEAGHPLWRHFPVASSQIVFAAPTCIAAAESVIAVGTGSGLALIDIAADAAWKCTTGTTTQYKGGLATDAAGWGVSSISRVIVNNTVNALAATLLPDAPFAAIGCKVPTLALATGGGVNLIQHSGTVRASSSTSAYTQVTLTPALLSAAVGSSATWAYAATPGTLGASFALGTVAASAAPDFCRGTTSRLVNAGRAGLVRTSTGAWVDLLRNYESAPTAGLAALITDTYNTGHLLGDIRRAYCADVAAGSITGATNLVSNGSFDTDLTGWTSSNGTTAPITWENGWLKQVASGADYPGVTSPSISLVIGTTYRINVVVRRDATGSYNQALLFVLSSGGSEVSARIGADVTKSTTKTFTMTWTATVDNAKLYIWCDQVNQSFTWYIDSVWIVPETAVQVDRSYLGARAIATGTLTKTAVNTGNQLVAYSGFSAANYLREPYSADLDFGTGEWSAGAWVNVPASLPVASFPLGPELITNGAFDTGTSGWTAESGVVMDWSAGVMSLTGTAYKTIYQTIATTVGKVYKFSAWFDKGAASWAQVSFYPNTDNWSNFYPPGTNDQTGTISGFWWAVSSTSTKFSVMNGNTVSATTSYWDNISIREALPCAIVDRSYSSGAKINLGLAVNGCLIATAYDGTTTRTVTTTAAYNTATWLHACATYRAGKLAIMVNGVEVARTVGAPLLTLNNSNAVLTIGNSYALDAPFPGSIALLKFSATVPTAEQAAWMYAQESQLFRAGAQCLLPASTAVLDLAYDADTDQWIAEQAGYESTWNGLVRTASVAPSAGSFAAVKARGGVKLQARTTSSPGVDVTLPAYGLREQLVRKLEDAARVNQDITVFDFDTISFTATTTNGSNALTSIASVIGTPYIGMKITGTGIPTDTTITGINGTTYYLSANATANGSTIAMGQADFSLPVGYVVRAVYAAGAQKREGASKDWTRLYDGFKETVRFGTSPGASSWVQIHAVKEVTP